MIKQVYSASKVISGIDRVYVGKVISSASERDYGYGGNAGVFIKLQLRHIPKLATWLYGRQISMQIRCIEFHSFDSCNNRIDSLRQRAATPANPTHPTHPTHRGCYDKQIVVWTFKLPTKAQLQPGISLCQRGPFKWFSRPAFRSLQIQIVNAGVLSTFAHNNVSIYCLLSNSVNDVLFEKTVVNSAKPMCLGTIENFSDIKDILMGEKFCEMSIETASEFIM